MDATLCIVLLVLLVLEVQADVTLSFSDSDGDKIGTLVQTMGPQNEALQLLTDDGYLIILRQENGAVVSLFSNPIFSNPFYFNYE